jgi:hypothetical protein
MWILSINCTFSKCVFYSPVLSTLRGRVEGEGGLLKGAKERPLPKKKKRKKMSCWELLVPDREKKLGLPNHTLPTTIASLLVQGGAYLWGAYALTGRFVLNELIGDPAAMLVYQTIGAASIYRFYQKDQGPHKWRVAFFDE